MDGGHERAFGVGEHDGAAPGAGDAGGEPDGAVDAVQVPAPGARALVGAFFPDDRVIRASGADDLRGGVLGERVGVGDEVGGDALRPWLQRRVARLDGRARRRLHSSNRD